MNWFKKFKSGLFTKSQIIVGVTLTMLTTSALVYAYQVLSLTVFSANTTISSSEVNNNFNKINEMLSILGNQMMVGISSSQTVPSFSGIGTPYTFDIDTVYYDYTQNGLGLDLEANDTFTVAETGVYQIMVTGEINSSSYKYGNIMLLKGTSSPFSTVYNTWIYHTPVGATPNYYNLTAGDVIRVSGKTTYTDGMVIDPGKIKVFFKKF